MRPPRRHAALAGAALAAVLAATPASAQTGHGTGELEIHYINVGQGGSTLIVGPDGTRVLYDFGLRPGRESIVPYLREAIGMEEGDALDYAIVSHRDKDHYFGYRDVIEAGFDVRVANYDYGSDRPPSPMQARQWFPFAEQTTAGPVRGIPVGLKLSLGDGAELIVVASAGRILGRDARVEVRDENDRSIALLVRYGGFHYVLDGDLGAGPEDCTRRDTGQRDVQSRVAEALVAQGLIPARHGVDVLHIAHHGSESSTSAAYVNTMRPEVGVISVGTNQHGFLHPREDVIDRVMTSGGRVPRADCVEAPPAQVFQTEVGADRSAGEDEDLVSATGRMSFTGEALGDIRITTDGATGYAVHGTCRRHGAPVAGTAFRLKARFALDETGATAPLELRGWHCPAG